MAEPCEWGHGTAPFRDELLSSWSNRIESRGRLRPNRLQIPLQSDLTGRRRSWVSASVNPTREWLKQASNRSGQPYQALASLALYRKYPKLPWYWYSWLNPPFFAGQIPIESPAIASSWCSRCLAEDYAAGRSAYIRNDWIFAYSTFCRIHKWPLSNGCQICGSSSWSFLTLPGEPARMRCWKCGRYLERSGESTLYSGDQPRKAVAELIAVEHEIEKALNGRIPDQFRFNFTSTEQLLRSILDIAFLLKMAQWENDHWIQSIDYFESPCFPGRPGYCSEFDEPYPLATARKGFARKLLAASVSIIGGISWTELFDDNNCSPGAALQFCATLDRRGRAEVKRRKHRWSPDVRQRVSALLKPFRR